MRLVDLTFVDLYLGANYAELKGLQGSKNLTDPVPPELDKEMEGLRIQCRVKCVSEKDPEFALSIDNHQFRVTMMREVNGTELYILRRFSLKVKSLDEIGLSDKLTRFLKKSDLKGLVIIAGETGAGKTTTASAILKSRLEYIGGVAIAIEDPPEINLQGKVGKGRCVQVRASRRTGGYKEPLVRSLRSNPDLIFLGEVREEEAAVEVIEASLNGHTIISTIHASSISTAVERLASLATAGREPESALKKISMGLKAVIWQTVEADAPGLPPKLHYEALVLDGQSASGPRAKIASGKCGHLSQDVQQQMLKTLHNPSEEEF